MISRTQEGWSALTAGETELTILDISMPPIAPFGR